MTTLRVHEEVIMQSYMYMYTGYRDSEKRTEGYHRRSCIILEFVHSCKTHQCDITSRYWDQQ